MSSNTLSTTPFFLPTQISGCQLWFDANDTTSLLLNGTNITQWKDKSGNGYNATGVNNPTYSNGTVNFLRSSSQYFTLPNNALPSGNSAYSYFVICNFTTPASRLALIGGGTYGNVGQVFALRTEANNYAIVTYWWGNDFSTPANVWTANSNTLVESFYSPSSFLNTWVNAVQQATGSLSTRSQSTTGNTIGSTNNGAELMGGSISEIIVYSTAVTTAQREQIEGYLAWKWGVQTSLPASQPYKTAPPGLYQIPPNLRATLPTAMAASTSPFVFFNPTSVAGCQLWFDASDPFNTKSSAANNTNITTWIDKSPSQNNMTVVSGTPKYISDGIYPVASFASGDVTTTASSVSFNTTTTFLFLLYKVTNDTGLNMAVAFPNYQNVGYGSLGDFSVRTNGAGYMLNYDINDFGNGISYQNATLLGTGTLNNYNLYDSKCVVTGTSKLQFSSSFMSRFFKGNIAELIYYNNGALSTYQRQQIQGYLAWKWGISSNLPASHIFKNAPPGLPGPIPLVPQLRQLAGGAFGPLRISGLTLWLDGADPNGSGVPPANNALVSTWVDKSGNGKNATAGSAPLFSSSSLNGLGTIRFNGAAGTAYYLDTPAFDFGTSQRSAFFVIQNTGAASGIASIPHWFWPLTGNGTNSLSIISWISTAVQGSAGMISTVQAKNTYLIVSYRFGSRSGFEELFIGGSLAGSATKTTGGSSYANATSGYRLGWLTADATTTYYFDGNMGEVLLFNSTVTTAQQQQIEGYLAWKWGLVANLPGNHPYKKWPPPPS